MIIFRQIVFSAVLIILIYFGVRNIIFAENLGLFLIWMIAILRIMILITIYIIVLHLFRNLGRLTNVKNR